MKSRYTFVVRQILILLIIVGIGGPVAVAGAADVTAPKGTIKKTTGSAVKLQNAPMTAADKAQEQKITDTLRQMGFNVTGISKGANGQYNVRVNKFEAAKATGAFKGVLAFRGNVRGAARQVGAANMNRGLNNAGGADVDSIPTPGGSTTGGPSIGDFEGGTGGRPGGDGIGPGNDGIGPGNDGIGPGNDGIGPGNDGPGPGNDGIGPGNDGPGPGNDGPGPGNDGPGPGNDGPGPGNDGPGGDTSPGNPTGPDDGGNPPPDSGDNGGGNPPESEGGDGDGGTPPTDPDEGGSSRVMNRDITSRGIARGNTQINAGRTALTAGGTAVLSVTVSKAGVLSISKQSLANAGLANQVPSAANGNVMFH